MDYAIKPCTVGEAALLRELQERLRAAEEREAAARKDVVLAAKRLRQAKATAGKAAFVVADCKGALARAEAEIASAAAAAWRALPLPVWRHVPSKGLALRLAGSGGDGLRVYAVRGGAFALRAASGAGVEYRTKTGLAMGQLGAPAMYRDDGMLDVGATMLAWRAYCERRRLA